MKNAGMFSTLFIETLRGKVSIDDASSGRMATLTHSLKAYLMGDTGDLWDAFLKQAVSYLEFVPPAKEQAPGVYPLYEDWDYRDCVAVLIAVSGNEILDSTEVGRFYPGKLIRELRERSLSWGILTNGKVWRLYSTKSSRPFEDYVELNLDAAMNRGDEREYALFERFFHRDSFVVEDGNDKELPICRLDADRRESENVLDEMVKKPFLAQVDEVLQYICNGFIYDTRKTGEEYTEEERKEIFESAVKLIYRALFLFYAEARRLLPSDPEKVELYQRHSINSLCEEARKFRWGERSDTDQYDLWQHLKGLTGAVNDGDPEYGIMGYNGGLFDDEEERFLRDHRLRNDFLARALYLLAYVEPYDNDRDHEYGIPYEDLEVRHLGELYENILEYSVVLADADRIRRRTKKGVQIVLASGQSRLPGDTFIEKGEVYFGESALERKQTGSYYTPESLVRFLNEKSIAIPLLERFEAKYRERFDAFKREALEGFDPGTCRGAAESSAELVSRFVEEELLSYTVCDPAMGSGHFLVDAANQMTGVVMSLLAEVPDVEGMISSVSNSPNIWRRRVTRRCIYGVDLNPLAVNLAKLSLWLNCFASEHKLTFLDHHMRCGNSLIGIRDVDDLKRVPKRKKDKKKDEGGKLFDVDDLSAALTEASGEIAGIAQMDEDDTDRQRAALHEAEETLLQTRPLADLYTAYLMNPGIPTEEYRQMFSLLAAGEEDSSSFNLSLPQTYQSVKELSARHDYFHWPLEFPELFGPDGAGGFNATIGNPPWDVMQPNTQEFYVDYDPHFRKYKKQEALQVIKSLNVKYSSLTERWALYEKGFHESAAYCKEPSAYRSLERGKIDLYKAFLERFFRLLQTGGHMGIVVPSGLYTDQGCQPLRKMFFDGSSVDFLYCFENRRAIFNIHRSFKFVLFGVCKGGSTDQFRCAFMEHDPERLHLIEQDALAMSVDQVRKFSPDTLSVMEFKSQREIDILECISNRSKPISAYTFVDLYQEFNVTSNQSLTNTLEHGLPLWEGKNIHQFDAFFANPRFWVEEVNSKRFLATKYNDSTHHGPDRYRAVFRGVARSTDERTLISAMVPPGRLLEVKCSCLEFRGPERDTVLLAIVGCLNSFVLDFVMRQKVSANINLFHMYDTPLTNKLYSDSFIASRCARLISLTTEFKPLWEAVFCESWSEPAWWYPNESSIDSYGPAHEQDIRIRLRDEARNLSADWGPHCGVHDRLPDRRDTGDRAQLRAEIDAYVAHLYGLSREDFAYILDTFPVLKNKEMKSFGEFMSKRKCLEEYDRIGRVLANE